MKTKYAFLIHGFTGGPWELEPLTRALSSQNFHTSSPIIPGHLSSRTDLKSKSYLDYLTGIEEEFLKFHPGKRVVLIGFSMGSLIAAHLASKYSDRVSILVLLAPPVYPIHVSNTIKTFIKPKFIKNYVVKLFSTPRFATKQFYKLVRNSRDKFMGITQPLMLIQGGKDHLVRSDSVDFILNTVKSVDKEFKFYPDSGHLLLHGLNKDDVVNDILQFVYREE